MKTRLLVVVILLGAGQAWAVDPLVTRGEYVSRAADCMSCHTAPGGKMFAGGDQLKTVFGSIFGPNITQDADTGIGRWSKQDFVKVIRLGVRKDGRPLYPAMPYADYTKMTDADLDALWAYMKTIPAVHQYVPPADKTFKFPFNIRAGMAAWQAIFFKPERWHPTTGKSAAWNRGDYLVTVLGHCGECHTPKDIAKAQETTYHLTGGQLEGWYAPDISNDPMSGVNKYSVDDIATFLKHGNLPGNVKVFGPMQETIHDSLSHLTNDDLRAIALYLKDEPRPRPRGADRATISQASLAAGKTLYENNCGSCHGNNGKGLPRQVPALDGNTAVTASQPNNIVMAMLEGFGPSDTWGAMGSFKQLTNEQIADIANYVRTAWSNHAEPNAVAWSVGNWRMMADIPAKERQPDLICPLLPPSVVEAALKEPPDLLRRAATDQQALEQVVHTYVSAVPKASAAQTVEALSTALLQGGGGGEHSDSDQQCEDCGFLPSGRPADRKVSGTRASGNLKGDAVRIAQSVVLSLLCGAAPQAANGSAQAAGTHPRWTESLGVPTMYVEHARVHVNEHHYHSASRDLREAARVLSMRAERVYGLDRQRLSTDAQALRLTARDVDAGAITSAAQLDSVLDTTHSAVSEHPRASR